MAEREGILEAVAQRKAETRKYGVYLETSIQSNLAEMLGNVGYMWGNNGSRGLGLNFRGLCTLE